MIASEFDRRIQDLHVRFSATRHDEGGGILQDHRRTALERYLAQGLPTSRLEEWKYTSLRTLDSVPLDLAPSVLPDPALLASQPWAPLLSGDGTRLVFVNGVYAPTLSLNADPRYSSGSLAEVLRSHPGDILARLGAADDTTRTPFPTLNQAFLQDGVFVSLPAGAEATTPIHALFITVADGTPIMTAPRLLVFAAPNSTATVVESYVSVGEGLAFTNAVTEIFADEGARIDHYRYQDENHASLHVGAVQAIAAKDALVSTHAFSFGAALSRLDLGARLTGPGAHCTVNGLTMADGTQHADTTTLLDHAAPHCTSHELMKSIVDDEARTAFSGRIIVRPGAQKTDAKQSNNNLLLTETASADSRPQLEIFADDVKCTHGATVGRLDDTMLFYLQTRGISRADAYTILVYAFASELTRDVAPDFLRAHLDERIHTRFPSVSDL